MTPTDFANAIAREKAIHIATHFAADSTTEVASLIEDMGLSATQRQQLQVALDAALRDFAYALLLGLDGAAQIGGAQCEFRLTDDAGNDVAGGDLEAAAWHALHETSQSI